MFSKFTFAAAAAALLVSAEGRALSSNETTKTEAGPTLPAVAAGACKTIDIDSYGKDVDQVTMKFDAPSALDGTFGCMGISVYGPDDCLDGTLDCARYFKDVNRATVCVDTDIMFSPVVADTEFTTSFLTYHPNSDGKCEHDKRVAVLKNTCEGVDFPETTTTVDLTSHYSICDWADDVEDAVNTVLIIIIVVVVIAVLGGTLGCCFCCPGCPGHKACNKNKVPVQQPGVVMATPVVAQK